MPLAHLTKLGPIAQTALPHSDRGYANFPSRYRPLTLCCASRVPLPAKGYAHADRCEAFGMRPGGGRRGNRENFEAVRIEFMLLVEPEEKLGRADPEQSRADHVREPVRVHVPYGRSRQAARANRRAWLHTTRCGSTRSRRQPGRTSA